MKNRIFFILIHQTIMHITIFYSFFFVAVVFRRTKYLYVNVVGFPSFVCHIWPKSNKLIKVIWFPFTVLVSVSSFLKFEINWRRHNAIKSVAFFGMWFHLLRFIDYIFHSLIRVKRDAVIIYHQRITRISSTQTVKRFNFDRFLWCPRNTSLNQLGSPPHLSNPIVNVGCELWFLAHLLRLFIQNISLKYLIFYDDERLNYLLSSS